MSARQSVRTLPRETESVRDTVRRLREWAERARLHVSDEDIKHLGPMGVWETIRGFATVKNRLEDWTVDLDARDPEFVRVVVDAVRAVGKAWFRYEVKGIDRVPPSGPALLVGNHNGGVMPSDTLLTLTALWDHFGPDRAVHLLGHDLLAFDPVGRRLSAKLGILRATPESASVALARERLVMVYPGSDLDSWRPFHHRGKVQLAGRKGFLRIALRERVPVVPVVSVGTHEQFVVITPGESIASRLRLQQRLRTRAFPIVWALPWGVTSGYVPYLPLPAQTTIAFGEPLVWPSFGPSDADRPEIVDSCYRQVQDAMQTMLTDLERGRVPWIGDPRKVLPHRLARLVRRVNGNVPGRSSGA
jgi:1-acyl-sn-glycerol-3-phosphate acyltransferase